jgi:hypothetical protein
MTRSLVDNMGLVPSLFNSYEYNIMISMDVLKDHFLKNLVNTNKELEDPSKIDFNNSNRLNILTRKVSKESKLNIDYKSKISRQLSVRSNNSVTTKNNGEGGGSIPDGAQLETKALDTENGSFAGMFKLPLHLVKVIEEYQRTLANPNLANTSIVSTN